MQRLEGCSKKPERKTIEKNRRIHMKRLCYELNSLVPSLVSQPLKLFTQENQFDQSISYIEQLRERVEALKDKRNETLKLINNCKKTTQRRNIKPDQPVASCDESPSTVVVKEVNGGLCVYLTSKSVRNFSFSEVISIVEDGGAEVVKGGYTTVSDQVVYILHAKARVMRIGIEKTSIYEKLYELINRRL